MKRTTKQGRKAVRHIVTQQQDEYACSCGKRWDVKDGKEHPPHTGGPVSTDRRYLVGEQYPESIIRKEHPK